MFETIIRIPDYVEIETEETNKLLPGAEQVAYKDVNVTFAATEEGLNVRITATESGLSWIKLRWNTPMPDGASYMGCTFERNYGTMEWRHMVANRCMPWYFFGSLDNVTRGYGVKVRPSAFCHWQCDDNGVMVWMDVRCGTKPVQLKGRTLDCATVVSHEYAGCTAFDAAKKYLKTLCTDPLLPDFPVYGSNNWYYAYGFSSQEQVLKDAQLIADLTEGLENRPFMVVDSGWQKMVINGDEWDNCAGGPNTSGNARFPDMPGLAAELKKKNLRPGIWMRFLQNYDEAVPEDWRRADNKDLLDPSVPEVLEYIANEVRMARDWGYELLKYDFSTIDILNMWGKFEDTECTRGDWTFRDGGKTTAEVIVGLYRAIHEAAPELILIGCNTIGHLCAGLVHLNRTGDDNSGKFWERNRRMGVNSLAFRLAEDHAFYRADADCVGILGPVPWEYNKRWAHLLAYSGTPFFASIKPGILTEDEFQDMKKLFAVASRQEETSVPLDWMTNTAPRHWLEGDKIVDYNWYEDAGMPRNFRPILVDNT